MIQNCSMKPIYWNDKRVVHACETSLVHPGVRLIWTLCQKDVPANAAYRCAGDEITCETCKARGGEPV